VSKLDQRQLLDEIVKTEREISSIKQNYIGLMQKKQQKNLSLEQKENIRF